VVVIHRFSQDICSLSLRSGKIGRVTAVNTGTAGAHVATVVPFDDTYGITVTNTQEVIIIPIQIRKPGSCDEGKLFFNPAGSNVPQQADDRNQGFEN
jgi:hypothetical protein